jgi:NAD(P)-dependent dehydrogenase (short-subunit alcohol dehydrogenase family)
MYAFVRRLAAAVDPGEVLVNTFCPGVVSTTLNKAIILWLKIAMAIYYFIVARSVDEGARMVVYATELVGRESHGRFLQLMRSNRVFLCSFVWTRF